MLLGVLRKWSPGITFRNLQGTIECNQIGEAYVDDTELWLTMHDKDITQLAAEMWQPYFMLMIYPRFYLDSTFDSTLDST